MTRPRVRSAPVWALLVAAALGIVWLIGSRTTTGTGDYAGHGAWGDNAGPAIEAIVHGHLSALPRVQTVMGLTSILWRVPFVALTNALGAGNRIDYAIGALACLAPLLWVLATMIARDLTRRQLGAVAIAAVVMIAGPATSAAILAVPRRRLVLAVVAGVLAAAISLPLPLLDPAAFHHADAQIAPVTLIQPMSLWWPLSVGAGQLPFGLQRPLAAAAAFALAGALVCGGGVWLRARDERADPRPVDVLALLALVGLLRCLLDPAALGYYFVAATIPLAFWEVASQRRLPAASVLFWGLLALTRTGGVPFALTRAPLAGDVGDALFLSGAGALAGYLLLRSFQGPLEPAAWLGRPDSRVRPPASPATSL